MNRQKLLLFIALAMGFSFLGHILPPLFLDDGNLFLPFMQLMLYSWGPAFAVITLKKFIRKESLNGLGWNRRHFSLRWIALAIALPFAVVLGSLGLIFLLGNVMHLPGFGEVILEKTNLTSAKYFFFFQTPDGLDAGIWSWFSLGMMPPEMWNLVVLILVVGTIGGATFSLLYLVGQEVGFRGFLLQETRSLGFVGSNFIIGGLFGLWQLPQLFLNNPQVQGFDLLLSILGTVGFAIAVSFPAAWLAIRTRSVYASATFLGVLFNVAPISQFFTYSANPLLGSAQGFVGMLVLLTITFCILRWDPRVGEDYDKWVF